MAALSEIEKLEARWAENPDGRYFAPLADAYRKAGRVDEAITVVTSGLARHPDYLSAHIVLGRCHLEKKDDAGASEAFQRVLGLDSENIIALKSLAEIAERSADTLSARRWLQRLLTVDAMNTEAAEDLARLGGPIDVPAGESEAPAEPAGGHISFADLAVPEEAAAAAAPAEAPAEPSLAPTLSAPALDIPNIPRTLERPALRLPIEPVSEPEPAPAAEPLPGIEIEQTTFEAPPELHHTPSIAAPAIDFLAGLPAEPPAEAPPAVEPPAEPPAEIEHAAAAPTWGDPTLSTLPMDSVPPPPDWGHAAEPPASAASVPTVEMTPVRVPEPAAPAAEAEAAAPVEAETDSGLKLIMPEDVTPADELRRPSAKQLHMVSPEVAEPSDAPPEPMVTETMGDLYMRQGLKDQAADVYRRLLAQRPDDAGLQAKLAAIVSPPALSANALGVEAVGSWLQRIARAQLPASAPVAPAPPPEPEPGASPMEQAFAAPEPSDVVAEPVAEAVAPVEEAAAPGAPARPATDQFSLDQIFGSQSPPAPPAPAPAPHAMGSSFDEFFGAAAGEETVRPKESAPGSRQTEDDLSAFNAWLHGLKR